MASRKETAGRFTVGDKSVPSLGAAIAYAMTRARVTRKTEYVRVIGEQAALFRAEPQEDGVVVGITIK